MKTIRILSLAILALSALISGCKTTESENLSSRPWNSPAGWEHGMPGMMQQMR